MIDQVHNETLKLTANWLNSASVAVVVAGITVPMTSYIYNNAPDAPGPNWTFFALCMCVGVSLHLLGLLFLGGLKSE